MQPEFRDNDERLCATIWAQEVIDLKPRGIDAFLRLYAQGKLTLAPTIKRARAKLQEECPEYRGAKYILRKTTYRKQVETELGYNN